ncbi:fatty acid desaturase [Oricola thermophila]|uniref:Fatty acid desaturase n=1 Tax=Oricola thermophila TaxID=2742145 RepID=A0A6N1VJM2_9HYPH|nr:fatty acid desaturase [Oricola thermophila]QKV19429.1 fatty acid desaturase [Oricola thermophila]
MRNPKQLEWPTVAMLAVCYGLWLVCGLVVWPEFPLPALALMAVAVALHSSLQHEVLHGHPTRSAAVNELLVALPLGVFYPYRRFRQLHLAHHNDERLTDPYDDPESWYRSAVTWRRLGAPLRFLLVVNNTLAGRLLVGPLLMVGAFFASEPGRILRGERGVRRAWLHHVAGLAVLAVIVFGVMDIPPLAYLAVAWAGMSIIAIRTYCEHRWEERPDGRTVIVENGGVLGLLFLYNNLHLVHHKRPQVPWYELPALYRAHRAEWLRRNGGYVFPDYWAIFRAYAFRAKEPVVHPAWRIGEVPASVSGGSFHPAGAPTGPRVGGGAVVPAKADRE